MLAELEKIGAGKADSLILDKEALAFRPNLTSEINPRVWHQLFIEKKITENQYFGALSVTNEEAKKAIGEDQLDDVSVVTLTKTPDLRVEAAPEDLTDGDTIQFDLTNVATPQDVRKRKVEVQEVGNPSVGNAMKRKIRL